MQANPSALEDITQIDDLGAIVNLDEIAGGELKALYVRLIAWAYARVFRNSTREGHDCWRKTRVWISMDRSRSAKAITTKSWNHVVLNDGLIEQLVWDAYRVGHSPDMFSWVNRNRIKDQAVCDQLPVTPNSPSDLLEKLDHYQIVDDSRRSLALFLLAVSFAFVIDHEYCHLVHHHAFLGKTKTSDFLTRQALEHDADIFATNCWADMLLGQDNFLNSGETASFTAVLSERERSTTYVLFLYAMFCGFRGMGQENWTANFPSTSHHPPAPFRFKSTLATLYARLEQCSPTEMNAFQIVGGIIWPLLEFLYTGTSVVPLKALDDVSSMEADIHFRALYCRWRELASSGMISGSEGMQFQ